MRVRDCPLTVPIVVTLAASLSATAQLLALHGARHAVVVERGRLVGFVSTRALGGAHPSATTSLTMGEVRARLAGVAVADVMVRDPLVVSPATPIAEAARLMRDARVDVLAICDQDSVVGLLTETDLLRALGRLVLSGKPG